MKRLLIACTALVVSVLPLAAAHAQVASISISGGSLSIATANFSFSAATLTGANQTASTNAASAWSAIDPRGTGASWTVSITGANLTSAAGSVETTARTIAAANLAVNTGSFTAGTGSDAASGITGSTSLALSTSPQTLVSATADHKGTYTYTPSLDLTIPANAYRSNYSGTVGSSALNAYQATLTVTVA